MRAFASLMASAAVIALWAPVVADAGEKETVNQVFDHEISNIPHKSVRSFIVDYAPGGKSPSHTHDKSAFIFAYVLEGQIRSQIDNGPVETFEAGQSWYENPGAHHRVSENASKTKPAKLLAVFVLNSSAGLPTTPDEN